MNEAMEAFDEFLASPDRCREDINRSIESQWISFKAAWDIQQERIDSLNALVEVMEDMNMGLEAACDSLSSDIDTLLS